jgi:hypothetical protein
LPEERLEHVVNTFGKAFVKLGLATIFVIFAAAAAWAQGASITGKVQDQSDADLAGAKLTLTSLETGAQRTVTSDEAGNYSIPSIAVGPYQIRATKQGFAAQVKKGIQLTVGEAAVVNLTLTVGERHEDITVVEVASPVSLTSQNTAGLVNERQVKELPLNGRSYDGLLTLNASTVNYTSQRSGGTGTSNSAVGNMYVISGHRPQENLFLLNGIEYTGASNINVTPGGTSGQLLGVEAVREFNVVADTYGAEYGKRPGGQVSIVTLSGTNQVHGSVYEFLRNSALDARNFFDQAAIPAFKRNQCGGALGGPIRKNKLFLFGNYEGFRQRLGLSNVTLVPDNAARQGYLPDVNGKLTYVGVAPSVVDLLSLWPVQNGPELGGGIAKSFNSPLQKIREDFGTARFDYNVGQFDTFSSVYTIDDSDADTPSSNPLSGIVESLREQVISLQEQHVISAAMLNTARFGFSRASYFFTGQTPVNIPGWVTGKPIGAIVIGGGTALNGASQLSGAGTNAGSNLRTARNLYTFEDRIAISHGQHQIETGLWIQRTQANDNLAQYQYGQASFGSLGSFLQGTISTFTVIPSPTALNWRTLELAGFIQDAVKLRSNLELRLGFRFESTDGWNEANGRASNYLLDESGIVETQPRIGNSALTINRAKFLPEPRIGISWDPRGDSRTIIRGGFGVYRALLDNLDYRLDQTAPFNSTLTLKNVSTAGLKLMPGSPVLAGGLVSPSGVQPDAYTPTVLSYTLRIEREIARNTSLTIGYIGSHGYHLALSEDVNEPVPTVCPASPCPSNLAAGTVYYPKGAPLANPNLANTTTWMFHGVSSYNALQVDVKRNLSHGLQLRGVYTFSKNLDDGTAWNSSVGANAPGFVMFPLNPKLDWGPANTDVRQVTVINATYEVPLGHGKVFLKDASGVIEKIAGGWTISGIQSIQSGFPFTPQLGFNPTNNGDSRNPIRPSWNSAFSGPVIVGRPSQYFDPNAFIVPRAGTYGDVRRNSLVGPGLVNVDISALKNTRVTENVNLQFRAEFFNVFNRANFGSPNAVVYSSASATPSPTAGVITSTATTSRQVQFGLKIVF